jgi:hypothetical protein
VFRSKSLFRKLRRAAALVLVGCYLTLPSFAGEQSGTSADAPYPRETLHVRAWWLVLPPLTADRDQLKQGVPINQWPVFGKYSSASACEVHKASLLAHLDRDLVTEAAHRDELLKETRGRVTCIEIDELPPLGN